MFKICNSVEIITEHRHFYEKQVKMTHKRYSCQAERSTPNCNTFPIRNKQQDPFVTKRSQKPFSEAGSREKFRKEVGFNNKGSEKYISRNHPSSTNIPNETSFRIPGVPLSARNTHNRVAPQFWDTSIEIKKDHSHHQKTPSLHSPHPVIARQKQSQITASDRYVVEQNQRKSTKEKPCSKPNIEAYWQTKKEDIVNNNSDFAALRKTKKKEPQYDPRHSEQTTSNRNSRIDKNQCEHLKKAFIFQKNNLVININKVQRKSSDQPNTPSPTKTKKLLQDAKSIISREASMSRFEDCLFEQSVLIERDIDMFQFITPIGGIKNSEVSRAVDRRDGNVVTLKFYREEKQYHRELQLIELVDGLGSEEFPVKLLKFKEVLTEDQPNEKKIIFVFQPFERLLTEQIAIMKARNEKAEEYISRFIGEVESLLKLLSLNGIQVTQPLTVEDFVQLEGDWRLHNMSKFRLQMREGGVQSGLTWLDGLRDELLQLIF